MRNTFRATCLIFLLLGLVGLSGCATGGAYSTGGNLGPTNFLNFGAEMASPGGIAVDPGGKTIFIKGSDITGHNINAAGCLVQILGQRYVIVSSPQEADYIFDGQVVQFRGGKDAETALAVGTTAASLVGPSAGYGLADSGALSPGAASLAGLGIGLAAGVIAGTIAHAATPEFYVAEMNVFVKQRDPFFSQTPKGKKARARSPNYISGQCAYRAWVQIAPGGNGADVSAKLSQLLANAAAGIF